MNELLKIILSLSLSGALLVLVLLLCKPLVKDRLSKRWQYYIWLIAVARLLLPFAPETNILGMVFQHFDNAAIRTDTIPRPEQEPSALPEQDSLGQAGNGEGERLEPDKAAAPGILEMAKQNIAVLCLLVWLIVAVGLLIQKITAYQSFVKYMKAGRIEISDMRLWERVGKLAEQTGIKGAVRLYENSLISSPLLIGFFRPCIMLTTNELSESDFENTILHELTHYKRRDMFYKWLVQFTICIHWFNPLAYIMGREVNRACELSCDEAVIRSLDPEGRRAYGDTLLNAMGKGGNYRDSLASVTLNDGKERLKERLDAIMRFKNPTRLSAAISIALVLTFCIGGTATGAYVIPKETSDSEIIQDSNESSPIVDFKNAISDIKINAKNCNVIILPSDDTNFKYEYDKELYQVSEQVENHSITITAHSLTETLAQHDFSQDIRIRIYIPSYAVSTMDVKGENAGISVLPFNANINLTNHHGAARVYLDRQFNKELIMISDGGSAAINMQNELNDYSLSAAIINSSFSPEEGMPVFHHDSQLYTFISGEGTASIKLDIQNNSFAIDRYSGEAVDLLGTHFDIVS